MSCASCREFVLGCFNFVSEINGNLGGVKREIRAENRMTDRSPSLQTRLESDYAVGEGQMYFNAACLFLPLFFFDT